MPASPLNFDPTLITQTFGYFWGNLAVPAANARLSLFDDLTPDSGANPNAVHFGHTTEGWELRAVPGVTNFEVDESVAPIKSNVTALEASIGGALVQTIDIEGVVQHLVQGFGTYDDGVDFQEIRMGLITMDYMSVALIWPLEEDNTLAGIYNLYNAYNNQGLANQVKRRQMGNNPVVFTGLALTSRAQTDTIGNYWKQLGGGS